MSHHSSTSHITSASEEQRREEQRRLKHIEHVQGNAQHHGGREFVRFGPHASLPPRITQCASSVYIPDIRLVEEYLQYLDGFRLPPPTIDCSPGRQLEGWRLYTLIPYRPDVQGIRDLFQHSICMKGQALVIERDSVRLLPCQLMRSTVAGDGRLSSRWERERNSAFMGSRLRFYDPNGSFGRRLDGPRGDPEVYLARKAAAIYAWGVVNLGSSQCTRCRENRVAATRVRGSTYRDSGKTFMHTAPIPVCVNAPPFFDGVCACCLLECKREDGWERRCSLSERIAGRTTDLGRINGTESGEIVVGRWDGVIRNWDEERMEFIRHVLW